MSAAVRGVDLSRLEPDASPPPDVEAAERRYQAWLARLEGAMERGVSWARCEGLSAAVVRAYDAWRDAVAEGSRRLRKRQMLSDTGWRARVVAGLGGDKALEAWERAAEALRARVASGDPSTRNTDAPLVERKRDESDSTRGRSGPRGHDGFRLAPIPRLSWETAGERSAGSRNRREPWEDWEARLEVSEREERQETLIWVWPCELQAEMGVEGARSRAEPGNPECDQRSSELEPQDACVTDEPRLGDWGFERLEPDEAWREIEDAAAEAAWNGGEQWGPVRARPPVMDLMVRAGLRGLNEEVADAHEIEP